MGVAVLRIIPSASQYGRPFNPCRQFRHMCPVRTTPFWLHTRQPTLSSVHITQRPRVCHGHCTVNASNSAIFTSKQRTLHASRGMTSISTLVYKKCLQTLYQSKPLLSKISPPDTPLCPGKLFFNIPTLYKSSIKLNNIPSHPFAAIKFAVTGRYSTCPVIVEL